MALQIGAIFSRVSWLLFDSEEVSAMLGSIFAWFPSEAGREVGFVKFATAERSYGERLIRCRRRKRIKHK